jgi:hypothetical protein
MNGGAMMADEENRCKACGRLLVQLSKGHRQREYCDDTCRQDAFRKRREQAERERHEAELRERFGNYLPETLQLLDQIIQSRSPELAQHVALVINAEAGYQINTVRETATQKAWQLQRQVEHLEQERAGLCEKQQMRVDKLKLKEARDLQELEQVRSDLMRLYQERGRKQEEIHQLVELVRELRMQLEATRYRIAELENSRDHANEQNMQEYQQKLLQAGQRINRLGEQVAIQRERLKESYQELTRYRQIVDLSDRTRMERQLYDVGEQIGYRQFIPADHLLAVGHGVEYWRAFAEHASDEELAQAIVRVRHYAENLIAIDAQTEVQRLKGRIKELECQLAQPT